MSKEKFNELNRRMFERMKAIEEEKVRQSREAMRQARNWNRDN